MCALRLQSVDIPIESAQRNAEFLSQYAAGDGAAMAPKDLNEIEKTLRA
jgi:hypothetical protein